MISCYIIGRVGGAAGNSTAYAASAARNNRDKWQWDGVVQALK